MLLYYHTGLHGLQSDCSNVRTLVQALVPLIQRCQRITSSDARSALFGLQNMYSSSREVVEMLDALSDLFERSKVTFTSPYDVASVLYSLQGMNSNSPSTRRMLRLLKTAMSSMKGKFENRDVSMSLYGLKEMSHSHSEVLDVIELLTPKIREYEGLLVTPNVAAGLQGMQKLKSGIKQVDELVGAFAPHIANAQGVFNAKGLSMALGGLQGLNSRNPEVLLLVNNLAALMEKSEGYFEGFDDFHQISQALSGFSGMSTDHAEVRRLVDSFARLLNQETGNFKIVRPTGKSSSLPPPVLGGAPVSRQWKQGQGVIEVRGDSIIEKVVPARAEILSDATSSSASSSPWSTSFWGLVDEVVSDIMDEEVKSVLTTPPAGALTQSAGSLSAKLKRNLKNAPKTEKVAMALYGMQVRQLVG